MLTFSRFLVVMFALLLCVSALAQTTVALKYDAKGRLISVDNGSAFIEYAYDKAGNRVAVGNERLSGSAEPVISSFNVTNIASGYGENATANWASSNTSSCEITFENQFQQHQGLPSSGTLALSINTSGAVFLTCTNGSTSVQESDYVIYQSGNEVTP